MPGYCVQGTIGHKILNGQRKLEMEGRATVRIFPLKAQCVKFHLMSNIVLLFIVVIANIIKILWKSPFIQEV